LRAARRRAVCSTGARCSSLESIVAELPPLFERFHAALRTCAACGTVHPGKD
jgi:hypothetical protein